MALRTPAGREEAIGSLPPRDRARARTVLDRIITGFGGALAGPQPLVRELIDEGELSSRSTLEALGQLVACGLLHARASRETTILWVPERLLPDEPEHLRPGSALGPLVRR